MLIRKYEMPWRRAYESYAGAAWFIALIAFVVIAVRDELPWRFSGPLAMLCLSMAVLRMHQALRILILNPAIAHLNFL